MTVAWSQQQSKESWPAAIAAAALFLLMTSLLSLPEIVPEEWRTVVNAPLWISVGIFITVVVPLAGLTIGWMQDFLPWSYPYVACALIHSLFLAGVATPKFTLFGTALFGKEAWGWRAAVPLGVAVVVSALLTRSVRPIGRVRRRIAQDWTLLAFAMFGFMPLISAFILGEDRQAGLFVTVLVTAVMATTAVFYTRSDKQRKRSAILLSGIVLTVVLIEPPLLPGLVIIALLAWPAAIVLARGWRRPLSAG